MCSLEKTVSGIDKQNVNYADSDFKRETLKSRIFKKILNTMSIITLFSICSVGINKQDSVNNLASKIYSEVYEHYIDWGLNKNIADVATLTTFAVPLYFNSRRKRY